MTPTKIAFLNGLLETFHSNLDTKLDVAELAEQQGMEVKNICFKVNKEFADKIDEYADMCGFTKAAFLRYATKLAMEELDAQFSEYISPAFKAPQNPQEGA